MIRKFSNVKKDLLLFSLIKKEDITHKRQDLSPNDKFLQVSAKKITINDVFKAHRHLDCEKRANTTQESWVVLDGKVMAKIYDIDNEIYLFLYFIYIYIYIFISYIYLSYIIDISYI